MQSSHSSICITSYNSTGFGLGTVKFIETLLSFSNIICLQEHFLQDAGDRKHSNTNKIRKSFPNHDMFINPAYKADNRVSRGRAKGGLATIWHPGLTKYVSKIKCSNFRIQATKFSFPHGPFLLLNTYFPCDPRVENFDDGELNHLLNDVKTAIEQSECLNILIAGDLNCHFERYTRFTNMVI